MLDRSADPRSGLLPAPRAPFTLSLSGERTLLLGPRTRIMGILNLTPDSFSDGGRFSRPEEAVAHALEMEAAGADLIDVGAESTRPGAAVVPADLEIERLSPVLEALASRLRVPLCVDTSKPEVAHAALEAGAALINDVSLLSGGAPMAALAAQAGCPLILMHSRGTPRTMAGLAAYPRGVIETVLDELQAATRRAESAGLPRASILVDPGFGFAKTPEGSLELLARLPALAVLGRPIVAGVSRKSFIGHVLDRPVEARRLGTLAAESAAILAGAHIVRTHEPGACREIADLLDATRAAGEGRPWKV